MYFPIAAFAQLACPAVAVSLPAGHTLHPPASPVARKLPTGQFAQPVPLVAPATSTPESNVDVPSAQEPEHAAPAVADAENRPFAQVVQPPPAVCGAKNPAAHAEHCADDAAPAGPVDP